MTDDLEPARDLAAAIDVLAQLGDHEFQDALALAIFERGFPGPGMEPFTSATLIRRTDTTLRIMVSTALASASRANRIGDMGLRRRAGVFQQKAQRALTYVKPLLRQHNILMDNLQHPPGTVNWKKLAKDLLPLVEKAVDGELIRDDALHDQMVDVLDVWQDRDNDHYLYKSNEDTRTPEEIQAAAGPGGITPPKDRQ